MTLTPEEQKTIEAIEAAKAAGNDPFGDDEPLGEDPDTEDKPVDEQPETPADEPETPQEPAAKTEPEPLPEQAMDAPAQYRTQMPEDYKEQRNGLLTERAKAVEQLMSGEIEPAEYAATEARISDALEELTSARIRAETLAEANVQSQQAYQQKAIQRLVTKTKAEVDYAADQSAREDFDTALAVVAAKPSNKGKDFADLIEDAHAVVRAMRGVVASKAPTPSDPSRKPTGEVPVTLRSLPSASTPNTGSVVDQLARLKGPAFEAAFSKLTPAQKAAMLDE